MAALFRIQILDESSNRILYYDRVKTSYGGFRIITSANWGKKYYTRDSAEKDAQMIRDHYPETCIVEIVEESD